MANEKRLKVCEDCIHFLACVPYADDVCADFDWQLRWAKECNLYDDRTNRARVVHGKWLQTKEPLGAYDVDCVECSHCRESWIIDEDLSFEDYCLWNYCPNCGAKMDGGNEDG